MKSYLKTKIVVLIILSIPIAFSIFKDDNLGYKEANTDKIKLEIKDLKSSRISGKIHINNNWSDAKVAGICTGSGSESDPYVIENLEIDGKDFGTCILIENSDEYFRIENVSVSIIISGFPGISYGESIPVKFRMSPFLAFLYNPFTSRFSHSSKLAET